MRKIVYVEMKKIFMRPVIRVTLLFFLLAAIYFAAFVPGGRSYYYDAEHEEIVEIPTSFFLEKEYANQIKGMLTDEILECYYSEYQALISDINNYSNEINLQEEKDRRYELLGEGYSDADIDKIDEEEPIYELKPSIKYNELWKYQPIAHLFQIYYSRNYYPIIRLLLSEGVLFDWCGGYVHAIRFANNVLSVFIGILIILGISTIFSEESQYKLKGMIFTTPFGRGKLIYAKIISSVLYTLTIVTVALGVDLIVPELVHGLGNGNVYIQLSKPFMEYYALISHRSLFWKEWFCIFVGAICLNAVVLLISSVSSSDFVSVFTTIILYLIFNTQTVLYQAKEHRWKLFLPTTLLRPLEYFKEDEPFLTVIFWSTLLTFFVMMAAVNICRKSNKYP